MTKIRFQKTHIHNDTVYQVYNPYNATEQFEYEVDEELIKLLNESGIKYEIVKQQDKKEK